VQARHFTGHSGLFHPFHGLVLCQVTSAVPVQIVRLSKSSSLMDASSLWDCSSPPILDLHQEKSGILDLQENALAFLFLLPRSPWLSPEGRHLPRTRDPRHIPFPLGIYITRKIFLPLLTILACINVRLRGASSGWTRLSLFFSTC